MQEILDVDVLMKAAAQAARRNDTAEAANLLRRIVALQEQALGPDDVELAPSLNNLALMLERQDETVEAERCYRRAHDIARRAVGPRDPLAQAARANLVAFLQATGKLDPLRDDIDDDANLSPAPAAHRDVDDPAARLTLEVPPPTPSAAPSPPAPAPARSPTRRQPAPGPVLASPATDAQPALTRSTVQAAAPVVEPRADRERGRRQPMTLWVVTGIAAAAIAAWLTLAPGDRGGLQEPGAADERSARPAVPVAPPQSSTPAPELRAPATAPPAPAQRPNTSTSSGASSDKGSTTALSADASLCLRLNRGSGAWRCEAPPESGPTDAVYFYTRVKTPRDLVVRHQWSYEGKPVRTVNLPVRANAREGFRTFSRQRVAGQPGRWEVSLLGADGTVVESRQFTVAGR